MKRKTTANIIMIAIIAVIVAAGILGAGYIQGWFDTADGTQAVLQDMRGVVHLARDGVSYPVEHETLLRAGDELSCDSGAVAVIRIGQDSLSIGEKAMLVITDPSADGFCAEVKSGEVFANCEAAARLTFAKKEITLSQTTALVSVRSGAQSISVLRGSVETASAGQILNYIGDEQSVSTLDINSLNGFAIAQIRTVGSSIALCFTAEDLEQLEADRQAAIQELIDSQTDPTAPTENTTVPSGEEETQSSEADPTDPTQNAGPDETEPSKYSEATQPTEDSPSTPTPSETTAPPETTVPPQTTAPSAVGTCTIAIYCDTILNNMDDLEPGKAEFVPGDGVILYPVSVDFEGGETVFDVLKRVCDITGVQLEYSWTPLYDSYYVEGINNLYEFDCGNQSGWMYKVNGWFPNYGCSSYTLKDGDVIVWTYTCKGLGTDVGAPEWNE